MSFRLRVFRGDERAQAFLVLAASSVASDGQQWCYLIAVAGADGIEKIPCS